jgi:hypothetical protein
MSKHVGLFLDLVIFVSTRDSAKNYMNATGVTSPIVGLSEVQLHEMIGEGSFGRVHRATCRGQLVAVKLFTNLLWEKESTMTEEQVDVCFGLSQD